MEFDHLMLELWGKVSGVLDNAITQSARYLVGVNEV